MSMELVVTDIEPQKIQIKNKQELLKYLDENLVKYDKALTEDMMSEGKKDRATLNTFIKSIDDKRKEVKKLCLAPYESIEKEFKEITGRVEEVKNKLDVQIKSFEDSKKEEKKQELLDFYNENIEELKELVSFEKLFNERMLNTTYSIDIAKQEIKNMINNIKSDISVLSDFDTEFELQLKDFYLKCLSLTETMQEKSRLERQKQALEEQNRKANEVIQVEQKSISKVQIEEKKQEEILHRSFEVWGSKEQIIALGNFMNVNGIKFRKIREDEE